MTLDQIALKYKTDKSSMYHNYVKQYDTHLKDLRDKKIRLLEIGVQNGYSIQMWNEYFYNADIIVGMDIDINNSQHLKSNKIKIIQGDQYNKESLKSINDAYGPFDIIIDDGCHTNSSMDIDFKYLFPLLKNDGYYIIEDLHCCYWNNVSGFGNQGTNFIEYLKGLVDDVNSRGKYCLGDRDKVNLKNERRWEDIKLNDMEKMIDSITFYKSICFIKKHEVTDE